MKVGEGLTSLLPTTHAKNATHYQTSVVRRKTTNLELVGVTKSLSIAIQSGDAAGTLGTLPLGEELESEFQTFYIQTNL